MFVGCATDCATRCLLAQVKVNDRVYKKILSARGRRESHLSLTDPTRRSPRELIPRSLDLVMSPTVCGFLEVQEQESSIRRLLPMQILMEL